MREFETLLDESYRKNFDKWVKQLTHGEVTTQMAEDAVQDACVKALMYKDSYNSDKDFDDWMYGNIKLCVKDVLAKDRRGGMVGRSV